MLATQLVGFGFRTEVAGGVASAARRLEAGGVDLILLDLGLGDGDGVDFCRTLRATRSEPVIMLTARNDPIDRIVGFEVGADDYVAKPFHTRELAARIRAVLRRSAASNETPARRSSLVGFDGWRLDTVKRELRRADGALVHLTPAEFDLLAVLVAHAQSVVARDEVFQALHGRPIDPEDRSLDLRLSRLRRKIEADPKRPELIKTIRADGFLFTAEVRPL